jgi:hypothetical protein
MVDCSVSMPSKDAARAALLRSLEEQKDTNSPQSASLQKILEALGVLERVKRFYESGEYDRVLDTWANRVPPGRKH